MSLRERVQEIVNKKVIEELESFVASEPRALRYFVGLTYHQDKEIRDKAVKAVCFAARHHPKMVKKVIHQLVRAMTDQGGTNGITAPDVLETIANEKPDLLLPVVNDLLRLAADKNLNEQTEQIVRVLQMVSSACPGKIGERMSQELNKYMMKKGVSCGCAL